LTFVTRLLGPLKVVCQKKKVATVFAISENIIKKLWKKYRKLRSVLNIVRSGKPRKVTNRAMRRIVRVVGSDRFAPSKKIAQSCTEGMEDKRSESSHPKDH
jgi:transposase